MSIGKKKQTSTSSSKSKNGSSGKGMKKATKSGKPSSKKGKKSETSDSTALRPAKSARISSKNGKVLMDKKGKKPLKEFVDLPGVKEADGSHVHEEDSDDDEEDDDENDTAAAQAAAYVQDMLGDDNDDDDSDAEGGLGNADFLTRMKAKDLAKCASLFPPHPSIQNFPFTDTTCLLRDRSRAYLLEEHRRSKPAPLTKAEQQAKAQASASTSIKRIPLPKIAPAKVDVNSDDEENMDALSDDDFANMGSSDEDGDGESDDLSVMSEFWEEKNGRQDGVDEDDEFSDSEFDSELDDDDDLDEDAWGGIGEDASTSSSTNTVTSNPEALENQYGALQAKRLKREAELESKKRKRLPTFGDKATLSGSDIDSSASDSDDEEDEGREEAIANKQKKNKNKKNRIRHASVASSEESESEVARKNEYAKRSAAIVKPNPYGARFGRPSVASILSISNPSERLQLAREEIASLGREITGEPELGMNLLKRLISFANKDFLTPDGETFELDTPVRVWAMGSALAVFIDILP
jgi:hypothetical protein